VWCHMQSAPTELELQAFFEEIWRLAERVGASEDWQLAPYLFELADEVAEWRNALRGGRALADF